MNPKDKQELIENVSIVYHVAASVRFDDRLTDAIIMNVRGTREAVALALEMKKIAVFIHVSTTYCNTDREVIEEKLYPPHGDWREALKIAEQGERNVVDVLTAKYIGVLPNTYTYTKSLAEHVINDMCRGKIPAVIFRPSIGRFLFYIMFNALLNWRDVHVCTSCNHRLQCDIGKKNKYWRQI